MARSRWKLSYFSKNIWRKIVFYKNIGVLRKRWKIFFDRSSTIPRCFSSHKIRIHKGKYSRKLLIHMYNVGFKFGEFSFTRKPFHFPLKKMKKRKNSFTRR